MNDTLNNEQIQKKAFHSTIKDGLTEIMIGMMMIIVGFMFIHIYIITFIVIMRITWIKISKKLKENYIFPRMGYVELNTNHKSNLKKYHKIFGLIMSIAVIVLFVSVYFEDWRIETIYKYVPIIIGSGIFGKATYFYIFSGKLNYIWMGIISISLAAIFIFLPFNTGIEHAIFYAWTIGVLLILFGVNKFIYYLHSNPIIQLMENS